MLKRGGAVLAPRELEEAAQTRRRRADRRGRRNRARRSRRKRSCWPSKSTRAPKITDAIAAAVAQAVQRRARLCARSRDRAPAARDPQNLQRQDPPRRAAAAVRGWNARARARSLLSRMSRGSARSTHRVSRADSSRAIARRPRRAPVRRRARGSGSPTTISISSPSIALRAGRSAPARSGPWRKRRAASRNVPPKNGAAMRGRPGRDRAPNDEPVARAAGRRHGRTRPRAAARFR